MYILFLHTIGHIFTYLALSLPIYFFHKSKESLRYLLVGLFITVFLDIDHLYDYFLVRGLSFNLQEFLNSSYFALTNKTYVLFHAWEWVALVLTAYLLTKRKILIFIAIAIAAQIFFDTVSYGFDYRAYFITFRYLNDFSQVVFN